MPPASPRQLRHLAAGFSAYFLWALSITFGPVLIRASAASVPPFSCRQCSSPSRW
jgi:hypothetical protein